MANIVQIRVYLWILLFFSVSKPSFEQRSKRFLTFPPTSPTRVQVNENKSVVNRTFVHFE